MPDEKDNLNESEQPTEEIIEGDRDTFQDREKPMEPIPFEKRVDFNPLMTDFANKEIVVQPSNVAARLDFNMNRARTAGGSFISRHVDFTSGDATPSVKNANVFETTGTTAITDFDDGIIGQVIMIKATANITITDGAPIILAGSVDYAMTDTDTLTLCMFDDQIWQEISRSVN